MADLDKIAESLSNLTILEASELTKILEEKWGVSAAAQVAVAAAPAGGDTGGRCGEHGVRGRAQAVDHDAQAAVHRRGRDYGAAVLRRGCVDAG